jgi:phosphoglycerate dehydrogenase-like enzyme
MGPEVSASARASGVPVDVSVVTDTSVDPPGLADIEVLVANTFPDGLLGRCPALRWLHLTGAGVDHVPAGQPRPGVLLSNSARVCAGPVAEFALMGLLALAKDAPALVRRQQERHWLLPDSRLVAGSRLLLVGLGMIGTEIARRAAALDIRVTAVTRRALPSPLVEQVLPPAALEDAAAQADHLILAAPATPATHHLIGERVLRALPETATVLNVGRAGVLDTDALVAALTAGRLRAALLDVHDAEPLPRDSALWTVPNLWITPHGAYRFPAENREVGRLFGRNLVAFAAGRPLPDAVRVPGTADG